MPTVVQELRSMTVHLAGTPFTPEKDNQRRKASTAAAQSRPDGRPAHHPLTA